MAYDEPLTEHIREVVSSEHGLSEKRMFGGQAFLIHGNLALSASGQGGLLRVEPTQTETLIADSNATRAVMRGREMNEWLRIRTEALTDAELEQWINRGLAFARSLPPNERLLAIDTGLPRSPELSACRGKLSAWRDSRTRT